jgi:uncharacterized oxidoreductase
MTTANISTILLIGATSGIGEQFARYFHSKGKTVIAAGRRLDRLTALSSELPGLKISQFDVENISSIAPKLTELFKSHPDIDAVFVLAGKMETGQFADPSTTTAESIASEITVNMTAPIIIARTVIPHLLTLKRPTTFITTTSGLAYVPLPHFPVYNATKGGLHNFNVSIRTQLAGTTVKVVELAPPYVDTDLDTKFRAQVVEANGGPEKAHPPMPLQAYMDTTIAQFEKGVDNEVATGFSQMGVNAWRPAFGPILKQVGMAG